MKKGVKVDTNGLGQIGRGGGELIVSVLAQVADMERARISERTCRPRTCEGLPCGNGKNSSEQAQSRSPCEGRRGSRQVMAHREQYFDQRSSVPLQQLRVNNERIVLLKALYRAPWAPIVKFGRAPLSQHPHCGPSVEAVMLIKRQTNLQIYMAKTCIICENPAGSGEHIFPAAFGGRRTNNGIYCNRHNNEFGRHVASLLDSMDIINAKIGVIPDRHDDVRPAPAIAEDGEKFLVSLGSTNIAPPLSLDETPELVGQKTVMRFANMDQAQKWIAKQKKLGYEVESGSPSEVQTTFVPRPLTASRVFGSEEFMRGVMYLAITFLAHAFPDLARSQPLAAARDIIEKDGPVEDLVWWEPPSTASQRSSNPFWMGHTVVIAPDVNRKRIVALVSFFDELHLAVNLAELADDEILTERFTTHIDPLARKPPKDIIESREPGNYLKLSSIQEAKEYVRGLASGKAPNPIGIILNAADEAERNTSAAALLPRILAAANLTDFERESHIAEVLLTQQQRILNIMVEVIGGILESAHLPDSIKSIFESFIATDEHASRGIASSCEAALAYVLSAIRATIDARLTSGTLDVAAMAELLGGKEGHIFVGHALTELFQSLFTDQ